ncbi:BrnA antitoxin family protein [Aulosira sp. FACHB-615]|uniref:BrnA antitoxin family protein n=1 Tax=Aulosira sp. FACHB-615 TaxID=2692777 RepID=UPI001F5528E4|nr:BrnA antitoxin family protein [Aulosira sp. FACHB-615]
MNNPEEEHSGSYLLVIHSEPHPAFADANAPLPASGEGLGVGLKCTSSNREPLYTLQLRPRSHETVSLEIPKDTLESLKKIADSQDMSCEALLKFYIGQGLRQDIAKLFSHRVLEVTAQVLAQHIQSEAEISDILQEIRSQTNY